jgi:hypothetical protein
MKKIFFFICLISLILSSALIFAQDVNEQALADARQIKELHKKYFERFKGIYGENVMDQYDLKEAQAELDKIVALEREVVPIIQPVIASFAEKYGTDTMTIDNKYFDMGLHKTEEVDFLSSNFRDLYQSLENVPKTRKATSEYLRRWAEDMIRHVDEGFYPAQDRITRMYEAKSFLDFACKFDPNNSKANTQLASIDQKIAEVGKKLTKDIEKKKWAGHITNFAGPGTTGDLAKSALEYFKNDRDWGKSSKKKIIVVAVSVRGQWEIAETNLLGQVIQWRLPIHLAITDEKFKKENIAQVFELSILAKEGAPGAAPKSTPFDGFWVGDNWLMRLDKIK